MGKNKIRKFTEINSFSNVIQPQSHHASAPFEYKGQWNQSFFGQQNPIVLEIGCGKGEYTVALGENSPEQNFIGIDIKGDRIWKGAREALDRGLHNVAFLRILAERLPEFFAPGEINGIWLTFPDPQLKKIRHKKRLTAPRFLDIYKKLLAPDSPIHLKTDNEALFNYTLEVIREQGHYLAAHTFDLYSDDTIQEPLVKEIQTFYEKKFLEKGDRIHYMKFFLHDENR